ncbi:MAG: hypothetical protein GC168_14645 [Candidatus Hydrogenedens sp.]|nr:hypothetical protein [Candidatus Hydrogenedens sp.]
MRNEEFDEASETEAPAPEAQALPRIPTDWEIVDAWLRRNLAGILYGVSAISLLWGIGALFGPVLASSDNAGEKLPGLLALNVYELGLLGVALSIVLLRKRLDDAVPLVALIGIFLGASGIALSSWAINAPSYALAAGALCLLGAGVKTGLLRRVVEVPVTAAMLAAAALALAWHFFGPPLIAGYAVEVLPDTGPLMLLWRVGWCVLLAGMMIPVIAALRGADDPTTRSTLPLLQRPTMAWIYIALLFAGVLLHQMESAYVFELPDRLIDYVPFLLVSALLLCTALHAHGYRAPLAHGIVLLVPLLAGFAALTSSPAPRAPDALSVLWRPDALTCAAALWFVFQTWTQRRPLPLVLAGVYTFAAILTLGGSPDRLGDGWVLHYGWAVACVLAGIVLVLAWLADEYIVAYVVLVCGAVGLAYNVHDTPFTHLHGAEATAMALSYAIGGLLLHVIFRRGLPVWLAVVHALILLMTLNSIHLQVEFDNLEWGSIAAAFVALAVLIAWRKRHYAVSALLCLPLASALYDTMTPITPWHFVSLGFLLLAAGAAWSLWRGNGPAAPVLQPKEH